MMKCSDHLQCVVHGKTMKLKAASTLRTHSVFLTDSEKAAQDMIEVQSSIECCQEFVDDLSDLLCTLLMHKFDSV